MKPAQLKLFQAFADLVIPLLGYLFWNWDFYFILLFFVLDYLIFAVFSFIKVKKVNAYRGTGNDFPVKHLGYTLLLIAISFLAIFPALKLVDPGFDIAKETWAFLAYEDLGIAQGIVLLPLLVYGGYAQYRLQFLVTGKFTTATVSEIWKLHYQTVFLVLAVSGIFLGISFLVVFPAVVYILALIFGVTAYRFFYSR